jgi:hypothetical protein
MKEQLQNLQIRTLAKNILILFVVAGFFCSLFPSGKALAEIQQHNSAQHLLLPSQNTHFVYIIVEKTKRQENIPPNNSSLFNVPSAHYRHIHFAVLMYIAVETLPSFITNLLYTQTTSSCL